MPNVIESSPSSPSSLFAACPSTFMQQHNKQTPSQKTELEAQQHAQAASYQQQHQPLPHSSSSSHFVSQTQHSRTTDTQQHSQQTSQQGQQSSPPLAQPQSTQPTSQTQHTGSHPTTFQPSLLQFPNLIQPPPFVTPTQDAGLQQFLQQHLQQQHTQFLHQYQQLHPQITQYQPFISTFPPPTLQPLTFSTTQSLLYQTIAQSQYPQLYQGLSAQQQSQPAQPHSQSAQSPSQSTLQQAQQAQAAQQQAQQSLSAQLQAQQTQSQSHLSSSPHSVLTPHSHSQSQLSPALQQALAQQLQASSPPPPPPLLSKKSAPRSATETQPSTKKPRASSKPTTPQPPPPTSPSSSDSDDDSSSSDESHQEFINYSASYFNPQTSVTGATITPSLHLEGQNVVTQATSFASKPTSALQSSTGSQQAPLPRARTNAKPRKEIVIPSELLKVKQSEAARRLGMNNTRLSKRWRESNPDRKWPHRRHLKLGKKINMLLQLQSQGYEIDQAELRRLREKRERNIQPTTINVSEAVRDPSPTPTSGSSGSAPARTRTPSPAPVAQQSSPPLAAAAPVAQPAPQPQQETTQPAAPAHPHLTAQQLATQQTALAQHQLAQYTQQMTQQTFTQQPYGSVQQYTQYSSQQQQLPHTMPQHLTQQPAQQPAQSTTQLTGQQFQRLSPQGHASSPDNSP